MDNTFFPFEILEIPASGSFATLCVARAANGQIVACKVLKKKLVRNAEALTRLRDEARMLSRLEHEGIVKVHGLLNLDSRPVMVMEWVQGLSLATLLRQNKDGLPGPVAAEIVCQTAQALHAALTLPFGDEGKPLAIIHRDIKPENILLNCEGRVKVLDFGTAKAQFEDRESQTLMIVMGSRGYTAPERMVLLEASPAIDVYSLGLSFIELLTGKLPPLPRRPQKHDDAVESAMSYVNPKNTPEQVTKRLQKLIVAMCRYDPEDRPTHQQVIFRIEDILAEAPADLAAFASAQVRPSHESRARKAPESHPDYPDLTFLGTAGSWETLGNPDVTEELSDTALQTFLATPRWTARREDLQLLLADNSRWTSGPFLVVLQAASTPWWQIWQTRPTAEAIAMSLEFLKQRKDPAVLQFAEQFTAYDDERVRSAAKALLDD